ncbi:protein cereblon-like [Tropilaelaps mercedesae]|uniref:Protein cereblon n=1 Tax=Tropilaelaps mercedesae TaxID=418985 RepID=A0A1V9XDT9_9ACAR|nr:protein cereblon-like [Tropilaelaps mercedesae]
MSDAAMIPVTEGRAPAEEAMEIEEEYDSDLTTEHSYLGHDLEELHGRTVTEAGSTQSLLVLYSRTTLIPGETLPLKFYRPGEIRRLNELIQHKELFGVLDRGQSKFGTTAEIRSYKLEKPDDPLSFSCLTVITEGIQQFQVLEKLTRGYLRFVQVRILRDVTLQSPEKRLLLEGQRPLGLMAKCSPWPSFLYRQHEEKFLVEKVQQAMAPIVRKIPPCIDAAKFSYWVTANVPVNESERRLLLAAGSTQERLRLALAYLLLDCEIACIRCSRIVTSKEHIISMSRSGAQGTFVNQMGYVHNLLTVGEVDSIRYQGSQEETYSWFPGYAWTIAQCANCNTHIGWRFDTVKNLKPATFWGLSRQSIEFRVLISEDRLGVLTRHQRSRELREWTRHVGLDDAEDPLDEDVDRE